MVIKFLFSSLVLLATYTAASAENELYEQIPTLTAEESLGKEIIKGENYHVAPQVTSDGLMNEYQVISSFLELSAYSNSLALERIQEMEAIAAIKKIKTSEAYAKGIENAANGPIAMTKNIIVDPIGAVESLAKGLSNTLADISASIGGMQKGESSTDTEALMKDVIGYNTAKRRLAADLNVDVYSSNKLLQEELNDVTWAIFAGGATIEAALSVAPIAASLSVRAATMSSTNNQGLWKVSAATLREAGEKAFLKMDLNKEEAEKLMFHSVCTLTHQTALVAGLASMNNVSGRKEFAQLALSAENEQACRRYQEIAELIRSYHVNKQPINHISVEKNRIYVEPEAGGKTVVVLSDYFVWTKENAALADVEGVNAIWVSGIVSPLAKQQLSLKNIQVHENVFANFPEKAAILATILPNRVEEETGNKTGKLFDGILSIGSEIGNGVGSVAGGVADTITGENSTEKITPPSQSTVSSNTVTPQEEIK
ncbi:MAG: hypothetical protein HQK84_02420 [Nitrospinae bacterium]|nr:hypothetical protein [Nitrospinota bacterium]